MAQDNIEKIKRSNVHFVFHKERGRIKWLGTVRKKDYFRGRISPAK